MTTPKLWRRTNADGAFFGSYHVTIKKRRINLHTADVDEARKRRAAAMRGQRTFKDDNQGAARVIAALDATPRTDLGVVDGAARTDGGDLPPAGAPPPLALNPIEPEHVPTDGPLPVDEQARPAGDWTADVGAAAGAADTSSQSDADGAPQSTRGGDTIRVADLPILQGAFVSLSKILVQLQIAGQVAAARKFAGLKLPPLHDPPPANLAEFLASQGQPWPAGDPREMGRQVWEHFLRRICPQDLPIPDWALAPLVVAACTLPVQLANAERIKKGDAATEPPPATTEGAPADASELA